MEIRLPRGYFCDEPVVTIKILGWRTYFTISKSIH